MAGRNKYFEEDSLIDKATQVFWRKGYNNASAKDLMTAMEIGQGSFYHSFSGGKKELFEKSLLRFTENSIKRFKEGLNKSDDSIQYLKAFFYRLSDYSDEQKQNGCYIGNAIMELSNFDEDTKALSVQLLAKLEASFKSILVKAQEEGRLSVEKSPLLLAKYLINLWNGINVTQRMNCDKETLHSILKMSLQVLD